MDTPDLPPGCSGARDRERTILHGLACEWEATLWILGHAERARMRRPLFRLEDMKTRWGTWSRRRREICLSRELVFNHSWDSVREVLLHETAHQLADEVLGGTGETPHGPAFRRACAMLRADPAACGRRPPLDQRVRLENHPAGDRILGRVRKLMALAGSPNPHEAEAAMAKAHELMERNHLEVLEREEPRIFASLFLGRPALRQPREAYALALLLQDFYFVQGIWVPAFVLEKGKMGRVLEAIGTLQNVRVAAYVHDFVRRFVERRWAAYNRDRRLGRRRKTDFTLGVLAGFRQKMEVVGQVDTGSPKDVKTLERVRDAQLDRYMAERYPHVFRRSLPGALQDPRVRAAGEREGRELVIHKGVHGRQSLGRLLGTPGAGLPVPERRER